MHLQIDALDKCGCEKVFQESASGSNTERIELEGEFERRRIPELHKKLQDLDRKTFRSEGIKGATAIVLASLGGVLPIYWSGSWDRFVNSFLESIFRGEKNPHNRSVLYLLEAETKEHKTARLIMKIGYARASSAEQKIQRKFWCSNKRKEVYFFGAS